LSEFAGAAGRAFKTVAINAIGNLTAENHESLSEELLNACKAKGTKYY
jgi:anti-anti-sigma regulatory factor